MRMLSEKQKDREEERHWLLAGLVVSNRTWCSGSRMRALK